MYKAAQSFPAMAKLNPQNIPELSNDMPCYFYHRLISTWKFMDRIGDPFNYSDCNDWAGLGHCFDRPMWELWYIHGNGNDHGLWWLRDALAREVEDQNERDAME